MKSPEIERRQEAVSRTSTCIGWWPAGVAALAFLLQSSAATADELSEAAGRYRIDAGSRIAFHVAQAGGGGISGRFDRFSGTFTLKKDIGSSDVQIVIDADSVRTGEPRSENFLRSDAVFDAAHFPQITFRSASVTQTGPASARLEGRLTARGKARNERFDVSLTGRDARHIQFHVTGQIMRSPYGMNVGTPIYSNVVEFDMQLDGRRL